MCMFVIACVCCALHHLSSFLVDQFTTVIVNTAIASDVYVFDCLCLLCLASLSSFLVDQFTTVIVNAAIASDVYVCDCLCLLCLASLE